MGSHEHNIHVKQKLQSKPSAVRHGRRTAWARHGMCELAFSVCNTKRSLPVTYCDQTTLQKLKLCKHLSDVTTSQAFRETPRNYFALTIEKTLTLVAKNWWRHENSLVSHHRRLEFAFREGLYVGLPTQEVSSEVYSLRNYALNTRKVKIL
jgi:hypothetical protein